MNRIPAELQARLRNNPFRKPNRYVDWNGHKLLAETVCKLCGAILTAIGPDPRLGAMRREVKNTKVKTVILETFTARLKTNNFDTIRFEVQEPADVFVPEAEETRDAEVAGTGAHRTTVCTACKGRLLDGQHDLDDVQRLYDADLERMALEDEVNNVPPATTHAVLSRLAARKVTRILG